MYCRNCGNRIGDNDRFCSKCGTPVGTETPEPERNGAGKVVFNAAPPKTGEVKYPAIQEEHPVKPNSRDRKTFDFHWDNEDLKPKSNLNSNRSDISWGNLLGKKHSDNSDLTGVIETVEAVPETDKPQNPSVDFAGLELDDSPTEHASSSNVGERVTRFGISDSYQDDNKFYTFRQRNDEFQKLLDSEREKVRNAEKEHNEIIREVTGDTPVDDVTKEQVRKRSTRELAMAEIAREALNSSIPDVRDSNIEEKPLLGKEEPVIDKNIVADTKESDVQNEEFPPFEGPSHISEMALARERLFKRTEDDYTHDTIPSEQISEVTDGVMGSSAPAEEDLRPESTADEDFSVTRKLQRDEFNEFLKTAETKFGLDELDKEIAQNEENELYVDDAVSEQIDAAEDTSSYEASESKFESEESADRLEAEIQEDIDNSEPFSKNTYFDEDNFVLGGFEPDVYDDEREAVEAAYGRDSQKNGGGKRIVYPMEKKKSKKGDVFLIVVGIILALEVAICVLRYGFPDTAAGQFVALHMTTIEDWFRSIF